LEVIATVHRVGPGSWCAGRQHLFSEVLFERLLLALDCGLGFVIGSCDIGSVVLIGLIVKTGVDDKSRHKVTFLGVVAGLCEVS
jgi:hypothetical protein